MQRVALAELTRGVPIARSAHVRKAKDLGRAEIAACAAEIGDDVDAIAARLEVSPRGLRLRMKQLGL